MIYKGAIGRLCVFAFVVFSARRGFGNQTISPKQTPTATLAPMNACNGTFNLIGDAFCNDGNNNEDCDFDGGDCCECTCTDGERFSCSDNIGFSCRDPYAPCFDGSNQDDDVDESIDAAAVLGFRFSPWMFLLLLVILMCGMRASYSYPYWIGNSEWSSDRTRWDEYMEQNAGNTSVIEHQSQATGGQETALQSSNVSPLPPAQ